MVKKISLLIALVIMVSVNPAYALFTNGGFETGDTTGWTVAGDHSVIASFTPQFNNTTGWVSGIPYYGSYSLLLGSGDVGFVNNDGAHASSASQIGSVTQTDIDDGLHLFLKWGAILEEPTNQVFHADAEQPYFSIDISEWDGAVWNSIYFADHRANQAGFSVIGTNSAGDAGSILYGSGITDIDLNTAGLVLGDQLRISLYVQDCALGGHGGLVFLDGFGTVNPDTVVPEPATMVLLGSGLLGLAGAAFKKKA